MSGTESLDENGEPQKVKIGARIRHARLSKGLVLKQVAQSATKAGKRARGVTLEHLIPLLPHPLLQATIHNIEPGGGSQGLLVHSGEEMGYVLQGSLQLTAGNTVHTVEEGDSFFFLSEVPHGYVNQGKIIARVLWVNTPPTF